jgi:hypothetical protein
MYFQPGDQAPHVVAGNRATGVNKGRSETGSRGSLRPIGTERQGANYFDDFRTAVSVTGFSA